jgi:hypothetical protein
MNHLPFKEWLLSEEPLTQEQDQAFQEHLRGCAECRQAQSSWGEIHNLIQRTPQMAPAAGFTDRWQTRLAAQRAKRQQTQLWLALGGSVILALTLILLLSTQLSSLLPSPSRFLFMCLVQLASLFVFFSSIQDYVMFFFKSFPLIPLIGLVLTVGFVSVLGVLWLATYRQLIVVRRIIK